MKISISNQDLAVSWSPEIDWETPAGRTLRKLFAALPADRNFSLTLFGSSPIQLGIEPSFTSNDVDLFPGEWGEAYHEISGIVERIGLGKGQKTDVYIQVCVEGNFRTSPRWRERAWSEQVGNVRLTLPHPLDLLIAKLHRLEEKDLRAFRLVIERTGHPTEEEMRIELQVAVDLYRPNFDETMVGDITTNTRVLWNELWGKDINVRQEIIAPAIELRNKGYEPDRATHQYDSKLKKLSDA